MNKILEKALKANVARTEIAGKYNTKWTPDAIDKVEPVQGELFSYAEFGSNWDKKFGEGEFARFEEKWNKRFGSTISLDNQLKQKVTAQPDFFDSLPDVVSSKDIKTDHIDLFRKLNPQDAVTGQLKVKASQHATDKSWENTEGWNTLYDKENEI